MLRNVSLFSELTDEELTLIEQRAVARTYAKGAIIISEGDDAISLYVIVSGGVKVFMDNEEGKEIVLGTQGPGDYFGELALIDEGPRSASIKTTAKSKLLIINKPTFQQLLELYPKISIGLLKHLAKRVRRLSIDVKCLALMDVYGRLAKLLYETAKEQDGYPVTEGLTQQDMADRIGSSREMVARILIDLADGGYIRKGKRRVTIIDRLPKAY